jgi:hypothetical protein
VLRDGDTPAIEQFIILLQACGDGDDSGGLIVDVNEIARDRAGVEFFCEFLRGEILVHGVGLL